MLHLLYSDPPLHGVQHALRAAFGADPDTKAAQLGESIHYLGIQPVSPGNALKRDLQAAPLQLRHVLEKPTMMDGEDVVCDPGYIRIAALHQRLQLTRP